MTVIRPITDADIDAVAEVHVRTWQVGYAGIVPAGHLARLDPVEIAERRRGWVVRPGQHTLVAEMDDATIAGFVSFGPDLEEPATGQLYAIYVAPERWREGIGHRLMAAAKAGLAEAGFPAMRLWVLEENARARRFYEREGLTPDGARDTYTPGGTTAELPEIRYACPL